MPKWYNSIRDKEVTYYLSYIIRKGVSIVGNGNKKPKPIKIVKCIANLLIAIATVLTALSAFLQTLNSLGK